ncbi:hypothetical protein [Bacillus mesophilum]|uniref:hypothetical protein n=1 Tax=Bacillus mesophilum TaxID=1071718 RepID=UPI001375A233|nr:hypothetical protein [Bacillus mesophilum]
MKSRNVWEEISTISSMLLVVYENLIEISNDYAGDELKVVAGQLMEEIQKLYPHDY